MLNNRYSNFVRASTVQSEPSLNIQATISGEEARRIYLEEIKEDKCIKPYPRVFRAQEQSRKQEKVLDSVSSKDLFTCAENNDLNKLREILDSFPDMLNKVDDYGWSLLMIACQANAVETVEELLKRGIDTTVRDKGGNSARSLVIKNKNLALADIFLKYRNDEENNSTSKSSNKSNRLIKKESYNCEICNNTYPDKEAHLSSTIHNISASKGKKIPANYVIPQTNKGYQLMLRGGWDKETGLGRDGRGKKYPLKTVQKFDRKGLGHEKKVHKEESITNTNLKYKHKNHVNIERRKNRRFERNFRREFY